MINSTFVMMWVIIENTCMFNYHVVMVK